MMHAFVGLANWNGTGTPMPVGNEASKGSSESNGESEKKKLVSDATWRAYYQAGAVALVCVVVAVLIFGYFLYRSSKRRNNEDIYQPARGNRPKPGMLESFVSGLSRWKPGKRGSTIGADRLARYAGLRGVELDDEELSLDTETAENTEFNSQTVYDAPVELQDIVVQKP
jgi:carboxypeptidase D